MDLVGERLEGMNGFLGPGGGVIPLAQYFKRNGDLCQDPEMVVLVHLERQEAEAFSFQQAIPPIYLEVYPELGKVVPRAKKELNSFLGLWLENLDNQGHGVDWTG